MFGGLWACSSVLFFLWFCRKKGLGRGEAPPPQKITEEEWCERWLLFLFLVLVSAVVFLFQFFAKVIVFVIFFCHCCFVVVVVVVVVLFVVIDMFVGHIVVAAVVCGSVILLWLLLSAVVMLLCYCCVIVVLLFRCSCWCCYHVVVIMLLLLLLLCCCCCWVSNGVVSPQVSEAIHMHSFRPLPRKIAKNGARGGRAQNLDRTYVEVASFYLFLLVFNACAGNHYENSAFRTTPEEHPQSPNSAKFLTAPHADLRNLGDFEARHQALKPHIFLVFSKGSKMGFDHAPLSCRKWGSVAHP